MTLDEDILELHGRISVLLPEIRALLPLAGRVFNSPELRKAIQSPSVENLDGELHRGLEAFYLFHMLESAVPALEQVEEVSKRLLDAKVD